MADHQKHLRAERWTSVWEEQVYIPPEERQQPKSWGKTNKQRGKETTKKIKLNDKELLHHINVSVWVQGGFDALLYSLDSELMRACVSPHGGAQHNDISSQTL